MNEEKGVLGVRLKWLGCAGFEMDFGGFTVVSDPFLTEFKKTDLTWEDVEHCDLMVLTHGHYDHITDIPALYRKFGAPILCGDQTAPYLLEWSDMSPMDVYPVTPDMELDFDAVKVKALFGIHTRLSDSWKGIAGRIEQSPYLKEHPEWIPLHLAGSREYRNYLFTMPNGTKVLHWGNPLPTVLCNVMRQTKADILIQQITATVPDYEQLKAVCRDMGTKVLIANHVDFPGDFRGKAEEMKAKMAEEIPELNFVIPKYNEWMAF